MYCAYRRVGRDGFRAVHDGAIVRVPMEERHPVAIKSGRRTTGLGITPQVIFELVHVATDRRQPRARPADRRALPSQGARRVWEIPFRESSPSRVARTRERARRRQGSRTAARVRASSQPRGNSVSWLMASSCGGGDTLSAACRGVCRRIASRALAPDSASWIHWVVIGHGLLERARLDAADHRRE